MRLIATAAWCSSSMVGDDLGVNEPDSRHAWSSTRSQVSVGRMWSVLNGRVAGTFLVVLSFSSAELPLTSNNPATAFARDAL